MSPIERALNWLRKVMDLDAGVVAVEVTLKFHDIVLYTDRFEWTLPTSETPAKIPRLSGLRARRRRLMPQEA